MKHLSRKKAGAIIVGTALTCLTVAAYGQAVISEMKIKVHDYWIEIVFDVTPGSTGDSILARFDGTNTSSTLAGDVRVCDTTDGCPSVSVATANGELFVEGDLEADGNLNIAGSSTLTGATTQTGDLTCAGGAGAVTFSDSASSVLLPDNDTTALGIGSAGRTNALQFDTSNSAEIVSLNAAFTRTPAVYESFGEGSTKGVVNIQADATAFDTAQLILNYSYVGGGNVFNVVNIGGSANTTGPASTATGYNIGGEQTSADGWEVSQGFMATSGRPFIIGTDAAFTGCWSITVADASGASDLHVGFRQIETALATFNNYAEMATIGIEGTSNPNTIQLITNLAAGGAVTTDTTDTWADGAGKTLCVTVSAAGVVTYTNDGIAPSASAAFTFTDGAVVIPFVWFLHSADVAGAVDITLWDVRFQ